MILCCGEALIDMIPEPTASGGQGFVPHSGGAIFNTAIALGRLGLPAGMLAGVSDDMFGRQLVDALEQSQVDTSLLVTSQRPTTLAFVKLDDGQASYTFYDENSAGRMVQPADLPALPSEVSSLYFGGISLACEPGADAWKSLALQHADTRAIILDPNIRAGFISDESRYRARLEAMMTVTDILKVSDEDLDWICAAPPTLRDKARTLLETGPVLVIVTRGAEGATGYLADGREVNVPARSTRVVDTVGAGDTFNAGVMAKLSDLGVLSKSGLTSLTPQTVKEALTYGAKVAAITVSRAGANPPWAGEI